jgi:hypothetical protein
VALEFLSLAAAIGSKLHGRKLTPEQEAFPWM